MSNMPRFPKAKTNHRLSHIAHHRRDTGTGKTLLCDADPLLVGLNKKQAQNEVNRRLQAALKQVAGDPPLVQKHHHGAHGFSRPLLHLGGMDYRNAGRYYQRVRTLVFINLTMFSLT